MCNLFSCGTYEIHCAWFLSLSCQAPQVVEALANCRDKVRRVRAWAIVIARDANWEDVLEDLIPDSVPIACDGAKSKNVEFRGRDVA